MSYTLPKLPYALDALEPHISAEIMNLHYNKHHQLYITNLNAAMKDHETAVSANDIQKQISLQPALKFNVSPMKPR